MATPFDQRLEIYAELAVRIALNVQRGQRLLIIGPLANGGASLDAAPLIRTITERAYAAGATLVEAIYGGAPIGKGNGNYRHGARTKEAVQSVRLVNLLSRLARKS